MPAARLRSRAAGSGRRRCFRPATSCRVRPAHRARRRGRGHRSSGRSRPRRGRQRAGARQRARRRRRSRRPLTCSVTAAPCALEQAIAEEAEEDGAWCRPSEEFFDLRKAALLGAELQQLLAFLARPAHTAAGLDAGMLQAEPRSLGSAIAAVRRLPADLAAALVALTPFSLLLSE